MKLNYVRRFSAYVSTFYHSEYVTFQAGKKIVLLTSSLQRHYKEIEIV